MTVIQTLSQKLSPFFVKKLITTLMTKAIGNTNNIDKPPSKHPIAVFSIPSNKLKEIPLLAQNPYRASMTTGLVIFLLTSSACIKASCLLLYGPMR